MRFNPARFYARWTWSELLAMTLQSWHAWVTSSRHPLDHASEYYCECHQKQAIARNNYQTQYTIRKYIYVDIKSHRTHTVWIGYIISFIIIEMCQLWSKCVILSGIGREWTYHFDCTSLNQTNSIYLSRTRGCTRQALGVWVRFILAWAWETTKLTDLFIDNI